MRLGTVKRCAVLVVFACSAPAAVLAADTVYLRIGCVLASNTGQEFDQRLGELRPRFTRLFRYTSYNLVKEKREKVTMGGKMVFDIPGDRFLMVLPKEYKSDGSVLMNVVLLEGSRPIINTSVSLKKHAVFLVGGPQNNDGALILSIAADDVVQEK
jgi:hypothetical protein